MSNSFANNNNNNNNTTNTVEDHYNRKNLSDLETRSKSPIYYLRNFNNWIKSVLISEYIKKIRNEQHIADIAVMDLGAGKGGDILKWKKSQVSRVTFVDLAEKSHDECKNRYNNPIRCNFEAQFIHLDATKELVRDKLTSNQLQHDMVSSQFVIHYSFESYEQADTFLLNVSDSLKEGGYFIGTTTDSNELIKRLRMSETNSFGNDLYKIKFFLDEHNNKTNLPLFGLQFDFQLDNVVECPEYLINFNVLTRLAQKHHLKLVFNKKFSEFFNEFSQNDEYKKLISVMSAMEPYYSYNLNKSETIDEVQQLNQYACMCALMQEPGFKNQLKQDESYLTISKSEWEAITLYQVFAFVKQSDAHDEDTPTVLKRKHESDTE